MRLRAIAYVSIAVLAHADAAWCQQAESDELYRWIPSLGLSIGVIRQSASAIQQNNLRPPNDGLAENGVEVPGTPSAGDDVLVDPLSVLTTELMTPGIGAVPTHPRLFVHGEFGGAFGSSVQIVHEGSPGEFKPVDPPIPPPGTLSGTVPGLAVGGQGTLTEAEISTLMGGGGVGVAFTADLLGRRLRL